MANEVLIRNWALIAALVLGSVVLLFVFWRVYLESARGKVRAGARGLRSHRRNLKAAVKAEAGAFRRLNKLERRADAVKPRVMGAAHGQLEEARARVKIVRDQVQIAQASLRDLIRAEIPPKHQAKIERRYLGTLDDSE